MDFCTFFRVCVENSVRCQCENEPKILRVCLAETDEKLNVFTVFKHLAETVYDWELKGYLFRFDGRPKLSTCP